MGVAGERPGVPTELPARILARLSVLGQRAGELSRGHAGTAREVFAAFLKLGCTSFGGPVAHLGYFRTELVERRGWVDFRAYGDLVGLCQFLPGPASSQLGFALGMIRAGWPGGVAAWCGFTLPSALLLGVFAWGAGRVPTTGLSHGLALVAVAVVAQAVWAMGRSLCPDRPRATIAALACGAALLLPVGGAQIGMIAAAAGIGSVLFWIAPDLESGATLPVLRRVPAVCCLVLFAALLIASLLRPDGLAASFYRSGALVFGGGHVVLPLLREAVVAPGWVGPADFLTGYGATQAMPGPLFTFAAYLGAMAAGWTGAVVALVAIFLPGLLLVAGTLPFWGRLRDQPRAVAALRGVNAAVVGLLGAALYDPVWLGAVRTPVDFALALAGFVALTVWRVPPIAVVGLGVAAGWALR